MRSRIGLLCSRVCCDDLVSLTDPQQALAKLFGVGRYLRLFSKDRGFGAAFATFELDPVTAVMRTTLSLEPVYFSRYAVIAIFDGS